MLNSVSSLLYLPFMIFLFQGICGSARLALVGGVPYLIPVPNLSKVTSSESGLSIMKLIFILIVFIV